MGCQGSPEWGLLLSSHKRIEQLWTGPAYWFSTDVVPSVQSVEISEVNADLLRGGLQDWLADVPHRRPFMAMIEDDHAVSVCASVRITPAAHAAGVETLPAYRQKGHAANVVAAWANAVRKLGAIPLYSTSSENTASRPVSVWRRLPHHLILDAEGYGEPSSMTLRLGVSLPVRELRDDLAAIRDFAALAEQLGFTHLRIPEQIIRTESGHLHEPLTLLAYLSALTERIERVPSVLVLPTRQTALVAKQAAEIDVLSAGRLRLGIGVGNSRREYRALGQDFKTRGRR